jgi:hypothetical protein
MAPREQRNLAPIMALIPGSNYGASSKSRRYCDQGEYAGVLAVSIKRRAIGRGAVGSQHALYG